MEQSLREATKKDKKVCYFKRPNKLVRQIATKDLTTDNISADYKSALLHSFSFYYGKEFENINELAKHIHNDMLFDNLMVEGLTKLTIHRIEKIDIKSAYFFSFPCSYYSKKTLNSIKLLCDYYSIYYNGLADYIQKLRDYYENVYNTIYENILSIDDDIKVQEKEDKWLSKESATNERGIDFIEKIGYYHVYTDRRILDASIRIKKFKEEYLDIIKDQDIKDRVICKVNMCMLATLFINTKVDMIRDWVDYELESNEEMLFYITRKINHCNENEHLFGVKALELHNKIWEVINEAK